MYQVFSEKLADDLKTRSTEIIDVIDYMAQTSGESPELVKGVKTLAANKDIKLIIIKIDDPPVVIASNKHALIGLPTNEIFSNNQNGHSFNYQPELDKYIAVSSILLENKINNGRLARASVGIVFDTSAIRSQLQQQIISTSLALILTMICAMGIVYYLTDKYIFIPLKAINSSLKQNNSDNEYSPISIMNDDEIGAVATTLNQQLTEIYQSRKTLLDHSERYGLALQGTKAVLIDWDILTNTMQCSSSLTEILGVNNNDFTPSIGWLDERLHDEDKELVRSTLITHLKNNTEYDGEGRLRHEDGSYIWIHARGQAVRDETGKATRMVGYFVDISKRKAHEHFVNSLYMLSTDSTTPLNLKINKILKEAMHYLNLSCGAIYRIKNEKCITKYYQCPDQSIINSFSTFTLKDTLCAHTAKENDIVALHNVGVSSLKNVPIHKSYGINSYISMPIYVNGKIYGTVSFFDKKIKSSPFNEREKSFVRLISQWAGNEIMRTKYIDYLHETEIRLEDAVDALTKTNAELENFAYVASHDLQEPLRMITNFTGLLENKYGDKLDSTAKEYLNISSKSAFQMRQLIKDLLDYARASQENEKIENIDLNVILNHVFANLEKQIQDTSAELSYSKLPVIEANKAGMISLLQNLISNGIKFQQPNSQPKIEIKVIEQNNDWNIAITDNGIGINSEYISKIFEPFKRLHAKSEYKGTGIGLAVCKKIVDRMGGTMWVESSEGLGSTFYITVPKLTTQTGKAA